MLEAVLQNLEKIVSWRIFGILFVLALISIAGFNWRNDRLGKDVVTFDGHYPWYFRENGWRLGYSPAKANQFLQSIDERGRKIYAVTQLTLDVIFPFVYCGLYIILFSALGVWRYFLLLPLVILLADLLENASAAWMALTYRPDAPPQLAYLASIFTVTKWLGVYLAGFVLLFGAIYFLWNRFRNPA